MAAAASGKTVKAFATPAAGTLEHAKIDVTLPALGSKDVQIKVTHCGVCHSDINLARGDWGPFSVFPQVSGHEVVGLIEAVGADVKGYAPGQRVGVGWYKDACMHCETCRKGRENLCAASVATAAGGQTGGFAESIVAPSDFVFPIPEALASEHAAPMLCGGITVYSPLVDHGAVAKRVGIVGIGGLGSMAIQFARARGNHVTALSTSPSKEALAKELGAHAFINTKDEAAVKAAEDSLDLIIVTLNVPMDFNPYLNMLKRMGTLAFVGAIPGEFKTPIFGPLLMKNLSVVGSITGGRSQISEMLDFAATHGIKPMVEVYPFEEINEVLKKVDDNKVRFRAVLKW